MMTNHHCVEACLAELSTKNKSLVEFGFTAAERNAQPRCSAQLAGVLAGAENVAKDRLDIPILRVDQQRHRRGNSGSPLIDRDGNIVSLMFHGNIHSIAVHYWFDAASNRAIALHPAIIKEALDKVYGATALLRELGAN